MRGASTAWGLGWSHFLGGDWVRAEAFLAQARKQHPEDATVSSLLAFCQSRRAKLQSAILSARRACAPEPRNKEHALLLFELLVEGGHLREAREKLPGLQRELSGDTDFLLATVRLYLLLGDRPKAEETTGILRASVSGQTLVRLGSIYEMARDSEKAGAFFQEALSVGHFPEALLGLGRAAAERGAKDQARRHALSALNLSRPLGENATGPLLVFQQVLHQLIALEDVAPDCEAWIASTGSAASPAAAANKSFLIYTPAGHAPNQWLHDIIQAMQPESASPASTQIHWRRAPKEQQPFGPVRPGVQGVFG
jgi:tetratricopeptide (TPR) repeat protein